MRLNPHERSRFSSGDVLRILEGDPRFVAVVNSKAGGNGVLEVFDSANEIVVIELLPSEADHADNHASRAACLR